LHRQYVITGIGATLAMIPCYYSKEIMIAIGEDPEIIDLAATYVYINAPGAFANAFAFQNIFFGV